MTLNTAHTPDHESRLGDILAAWLEAVESGQSPDRAAWLARHPEFAAELTEFFADHDELHAVAAPLRDVAQAAATPQSPGLGDHHPRLAPEASSFGDYELLEVLGQGGMGVVYKARQKSLSRLVALKMIRADRLASTEQVRRIRNEAEAVAALDHPGVVPIYEVGECAGQPFFTMKLLEGGSLAGGMANGSKVVANIVAGAEVLRSPGPGQPGDRSPLPQPGLRSTSAPATRNGITSAPITPPRTAARLLAQVALAVHHAHQRGILHRDLKPSNILLDAEGRPHVADFGLAKWLTGDSSLTGTGAVVGTPSYAAPEQASANPRQLTTAADVYGLGAILYALLTGRPPFQGETPLHTLDLLRQEEPVAPRRLNRAIPADLETIVAKAMDKNPEARYGTAKEMAEDLERFLKDEPIWARRPSFTRRLTGWCRRHPSVTWSAIVTLILVALGSALAALFFQQQEAEQRELTRDADTQRHRAERNAIEAQNQTAKAMEAKQDAERQRSAVYQNLYRADMRLGLADWNGGNLSRLSDKLRSHAPRTGADDVRNWEWYYLLSVCHQDERTLTDHAGQINAVAWSPDGRYLASASNADRTTKVWDTTSWRLLRTFGSGLSGVSWSSDSQRLAWGSYFGGVYVWHVPTGEVQVLRGHTGNVWKVAWSSNGKRLASVSFDESIRVWEPATGSCIHVLKASGNIRALAWHPDGKMLASAGYGELVRIWDTVSGKILREDIYAGQAYSVAWSPDGNQLALGTDGQCRLYKTADWSDAAQWVAHTGLVRCLAWNSDGSRLASGGSDGLVKVWDPESAACVLTLRGHLNQVMSVAWEPGGRRLASAGTDGNVKIWALPPVLQPRRLEGRKGGLQALCWSEQGDTLRSLDAAKGLVTLWNVATGECLGQTLVARGQSGWFSAGGRLVAVADGNASRLQICDARSGKLVQIVNAKADGFSSFSPDASQLMLRNGNAVHVVNLGENEMRFRWDITLPQGGSWSPDGRLLAIAGHGDPADGEQTWARWVHVFDIEKRQRVLKLRHMESGEGAADAITWSPNGKQLVSGDNTGLAVVWEVSSGRLVAEAKLHTASIRTLAWSPDGRRVASGSDDRTVRIWDPRYGEELLRFDVPNVAVTKLHWSPDGRRLAAGCTDGSIQIWDASAGYDYAHSAAYALEPVHAYRRQAQELLAQERRDDAVGLLERTVELSKTEVGLDHVDTLQSMDELADAYGRMGRWQQAIALFQQKLKNIKGTDHPDTLQTMDKLANAYIQAGQLQEGITLREQTLEKSKAKLGPDHLDTLQSMETLGYAYWRAGRFKEAITVEEQALEKSKAKLGLDHSDTLRRMDNLAESYADAGRHADALALRERAMEITKIKLGQDHPDTLGSMSDLADAYQRAGKLDQADRLLRDLLERERKKEEPKANNSHGLLARLGHNMLKQQRYVEAEPLLRECLEFREKKLPDNWLRFNAMSMLGDALLGQKKHAEAEPLLLKGYEGMKQREATIPGEVKIIRLTEAVERIVRLYEATEQAEKARVWREKLPAKKTPTE